MKKIKRGTFAEIVFWLLIIAFVASIIALSMTPGCAAPQDGSVSGSSGKTIGDDQQASAQSQGGFSWVWIGGGGTVAGLITLGSWMRHIRKQDDQQNRYTIELIGAVRGDGKAEGYEKMAATLENETPPPREEG